MQRAPLDQAGSRGRMQILWALQDITRSPADTDRSEGPSLEMHLRERSFPGRRIPCRERPLTRQEAEAECKSCGHFKILPDPPQTRIGARGPPLKCICASALFQAEE